MPGVLQRRPYGRTGERATVNGLSGAALSKYSFADGVVTVRRALDLGIDYFDTSVPMAVRFLLGDPDFTTILIGAGRPAEIEERVPTARQGPLPPDLQPALEAIGSA